MTQDKKKRNGSSQPNLLPNITSDLITRHTNSNTAQTQSFQQAENELPYTTSLNTSEHVVASRSTTTDTTASTADYNFSLEDDVEHDETNCFHYGNVNSLTNFNRLKWLGRSEFLLVLVGYTIGLGNAWRFPYLCHKNGGASFLIPYFVFLVAEGIPLYYMELCIGQRLRKGSVGAWHIVSPYLDGLGIASAIVCLLTCLYYNVILSWCMVYLVNSFKSPLPWSTCPTNTITKNNMSFTLPLNECTIAGPTKYFWYRTTLNISSHIDEGSIINWNVALSLLAAWMLCWLSRIKGIRSEGKVVYVTATLPLLLLAILFLRGVHLEGFQDGLALLFIPKFQKLADPIVWLDAASQTFYSLGIAYGSLIAFASYNPLKNDTTRDAITICLINAGVSVYASVVIFCFMGYRAQIKMNSCMNQTGAISIHDDVSVFSHLQSLSNPLANFTNVTICNKHIFLSERAQSTELAFITFAEAINTLPQPQMWSILFFLMLLTLGVDTQFGMLEGFLTPLFDAKLFPKIKAQIVTGIICLSLYILSLTMVQQSGNYWLQIFENYCSGIPLLLIALVECLSLSYIYGMEKFSNDIEYMTNRKPRTIWIICWKFVSPLLIIVVLVFSVRSLSINTQKYQVWNKETGQPEYIPLPKWGLFLGMTLMFISILFIPFIAFLRYYNLIETGSNNLNQLCCIKKKKNFEKYSLTYVVTEPMIELRKTKRQDVSL